MNSCHALSGLYIVLLPLTFFLCPCFAEANTIFLTNTALSTWAVPSDWNNASNTIEVLGGGAGGYLKQSGGGGGGYSFISNVTLIPGATVTVNVGSGGAAGTAGGDTYFCNSSTNCNNIGDTSVLVGAKGGSVGNGTYLLVGAGGAAASGVGTTK